MTRKAVQATIAAMQARADDRDGVPGNASAGAPAWRAQAAVFLDIDGTLVPHEERPGDVHIDGALRALLERAREAAGGSLALISGRSIADIDALFSPAIFAVAGQHGAERRSADGRLHFHAPRASRLQGQAARLRDLVRAYPPLLLEEKGTSLALHFRGEPALGVLAEREARRAVVALGDDFELLAGKFVFEVKPSGKDKGTAIDEFMAEEPFAGRRPVFVGDDLTDELGFERVNRLGGDSVKVGPGTTRARWRLADAGAVRGWLSGLGAAARDGAPEGRKR
jgi:trehalose 6-phosphate phosphatase